MTLNLLAIQIPQVLYSVLNYFCLFGATLCALFVIVVVLVQPGNSNGISALGNNAETFFNKDKGKTLESKLKRLTYICIAIIAVLMIVYLLLQNNAIITVR